MILDYPRNNLEVIEPATFTYQGSGTSVPVTDVDKLPVVSGTITPFTGDPIRVKLIVDSGGSAVSVDIHHPFEARFGLSARLRDARDSYVTMFTGDRPSKRGRVQSLTIGGVKIDEPEVQVVAPSKEGSLGDWDGTLGAGFLKQFRVIFDLLHDRVIFERP